MGSDTRAMAMESGTRTSARILRLPERVRGGSRILLISLEVALLLFSCMLAFSGASNRIGAALVSALVISAIAWNGRLYVRSFAVYARDEVYYACACVVLAAPAVLLLASVIGHVPVTSTLLALALCALTSSVVRAFTHLQRRQERDVIAWIDSITHHGWARREQMSYRFCKRAFDLTTAVLASVVLLPVMAIVAAAILLESGRPILFAQERVGLNGEIFTMFKFRTMRNDAGDSWVRPGDERITRIGQLLRRSSVDELPQLFNVLAGHMSIIGPRPEMVEFARQFAELHPAYPQRHVVLPGITGWAQLYYKRNLTPEDVGEVLPYDLFYVEYASIVMDCALIIKTISEVLFHRAV